MHLYSKIEGIGRPLVILHGFLGMSDNWKTLGDRYAKSGFEIHLLDLRNHGRSFHSDEFSYDAMANDLLIYCTQHKLEKINIIGHSMGGKVAMHFAINYPEKVDKLIIADIGPQYYEPHHHIILDALKQVDFSIVSNRAQAEEVLKKHIPDTGTRQFLLKNLYWKNQNQLDWRFNLAVFIKSQHIIGEALKSNVTYEKPVLFLRGGKSNYIVEDDFDQIKSIFPKAYFAAIEDAGHWLHAEKPEEFYTLTLSFLNA